MPKLADVIQFRGDRLFNGAVSLDWLWTKPELSSEATQAYIFHGPSYHGVNQQDVGTEHGHHLQDTATFTRSILRRCHGLEEEPFTLAIAGYGTGKSHLSLALANLFQYPEGQLAKTLLSRISEADSSIGAESRAIVKEDSRPFLTVAINGMKNCDLTAELTKQILIQARSHNLDTRVLDDLRPRFRQATTLVKLASHQIAENLIENCGVSSVNQIIEALKDQDENIYAKAQTVFEAEGIPIRAFGGESTKDVLDVTVKEYCGKDKPFAGILILFDEFGRYTEFATIRSQIAGSGVLQDLFEGIQANSEHVTFVGFIQFELNAYVQRVAPEYKNEILRYVSRYQSANKSYLSTNLETLVANLIDKKDTDLLDNWFEKDEAKRHSQHIIKQIHRWFPQSQNYKLWSDEKRFHQIIYKGCWPLSPYSMWLLFHLTSAGKHLQERSALTLLEEALQHCLQVEIPGPDSWSLSPVDLWSNALQEELLSSEEFGQQGSITHAYMQAISKHKAQLPRLANRILRCIVISAKLGLYVKSKEEAANAFAVFTDISAFQVNTILTELQDEFNLIEWDNNHNQFDILGDAVPRSQFLSYLRNKISTTYDDHAKAALFATHAQEWCDLLGNLDCDFAEENNISTREWQFKSITTQIQYLETQLKFGIEEWKNSITIDAFKGFIFYCYLEPSKDPYATALEVRKIIRRTEKETGFSRIPFFVALLYDEEGELGQSLAELSILLEGISDEDRAKFGNLIAAHQEKAQKNIKNQIESMLREQRFVTSLGDELKPARRNRFATELFAHIYKKPIPFPFDGFSTTRGNAADTCHRLIIELINGQLDFESVTSKPAKEKNRALRVLNDTWRIFTSRGSVSRKPDNTVVRSVAEAWDQKLRSDHLRFFISQEIKLLCLPPYGANIASASLLFATYISSRANNLIIARDGQNFAINQWLKEGIFHGKYLDLKTIEKDELLQTGGESSEWEELLAEWEQAESYSEQVEYYKKATELQQRIPVPPARQDRFAHLVERTSEAQKILNKIDRQTEDEIRKMQKGHERGDLGVLTWGATSLKQIQKRMVSEKPLWTEKQIDDLSSAIEQACQVIIELFPKWLSNQHPVNDKPDTIGEFKHKMLNKIGGNLKTLDLDDQFEQLKKRVTYLVRNAETAAEAKQLIRDVSNWIYEHKQILRNPKISEIRGLKDIAKGYAKKLQIISQKIEIEELQNIRAQLAEFNESLKIEESKIIDRASDLWNSDIKNEEDLEIILKENRHLMRAFEGLDADLEDMTLIEQALNFFQKGCNQLSREDITWDKFNCLVDNWQSDMLQALGDEELPWDIKETISVLSAEKSEHRKKKSSSWITELENTWEAMNEPTVLEANRLYDKLSTPPPFATDSHREKATRLLNKVEKLLETLKVEWLVEKFKEMPFSSQKKFLNIADLIIEGKSNSKQ